MVNFPQNSWKPIFDSAQKYGMFEKITQSIQNEKNNGKIVFPPSPQVFRAFDLCDFDNLKVVILGQDPYHGINEANGLCFSVNEGVKTPPSLRNIFKEMNNSIADFDINRSTDLSDWAKQGVLLTNSVLTVNKDSPASHSKFGWQEFTDHIITEVSKKKDNVIFILLGNYAKSKSELIDTSKHTILTTTHPSPFSAHRGFLGSNIFIKCNEVLGSKNLSPIKW